MKWPSTKGKAGSSRQSAMGERGPVKFSVGTKSNILKADEKRLMEKKKRVKNIEKWRGEVQKGKTYESFDDWVTSKRWSKMSRSEVAKEIRSRKKQIVWDAK